jgi:mRNA degradation ribonuclease J1/J2
MYDHTPTPVLTPVFLISFPNVHHAFKCEHVMRKTGRRVQVMPVPRRISSSCGLAVQVQADDIVHGEDVARELENGGVDYEALFLLRQDGQYELISEGTEENRRQ